MIMKNEVRKLRWITGILTVVFTLSGLPSSTAQELRMGGDAQILGTINRAFIGPALGLEGKVDKHLTLSLDYALGYQRLGRLRTIRPGINYYFGEQHNGFFFGLMMKYMRFREKAEIDRYDDRLFATGFSIGVKGRIFEKTNLVISTNPHLTMGGRDESDVAGINIFLGITHRL